MDNIILQNFHQSDGIADNIGGAQSDTEPGRTRKQLSLHSDRAAWRARKRRAHVMAVRLKAVGKLSRSWRMLNCAETIISDVCPKCETRYLAEVAFCRDRLCPVCSWRRARRLARKLGGIVRICEREKPSRYALLVLSVRNVPWAGLATEIERVMHGWKIFHMRLERAGHVTGWARSLEIVRAANGNAHPHLHVLIQVLPAYFDRENSIYLAHRHADLVRHWRECLGADYDPNIDIRALEPEDGNITDAVHGVARYIAKAGDVEGLTDGEFLHYISALSHVRSWGTGGRMKITRGEIDSSLHRDGEQDSGGAGGQSAGTCENCGDMLREMREVWSPAGMEYVIKANPADVDYNRTNCQNKTQKENPVIKIKTMTLNVYNLGPVNVYVGPERIHGEAKDNA